MIWGNWCSGTCSALSTSSLSANGNKYLLGFNEPDNSTQSNMSVATALQLWPYLEATGLQLGSPAPTGSSTGTSWLASFMAGAKTDGYRVNWIDLHWYGDCSNPQNLISYLTTMENTYNLPIWLTEFSCVNVSYQANATFIQQITPLFQKLPWLQRWAWFDNRPYSGASGYGNTNLIDSSGALTLPGSAFITEPGGS
jgi:hypothetical protein